MPAPGEEGQCRSFEGMRHAAVKGERAALWARGSFEGLNGEGQPSVAQPGERRGAGGAGLRARAREAGEVRRRGQRGRAGRRRPGARQGRRAGAAPSLPAFPAAGRAGPGHLSPVSRFKEMRASAR